VTFTGPIAVWAIVIDNAGILAIVAIVCAHFFISHNQNNPTHMSNSITPLIAAMISIMTDPLLA